MKRIAIPLESDKLSEYLEQCKHIVVFEIDEKHIHRKLIDLPFVDFKKKLPIWLDSVSVTDLIMYKIDKQLLNLLQSHKINLFIGVKIDKSDRIISDYMDGKLYSDDAIITEILASGDEELTLTKS